MFSYGFQPWAALTGQQILEAIDEPSYQRLEQPECCPKEYYSLMLKCWAHDPNLRPKFSEIMLMLPDCKPELVQCVKESDWSEQSTGRGVSPSKAKKDLLCYKIGDIVTVLDKRNSGRESTVNSNCSDLSSLEGSYPHLWKGALNNGRVGYFNPSHVVAYLGQNLPTSSSTLSSSTTTVTATNSSTSVMNKTQNFIRGILDSRNNNNGVSASNNSNNNSNSLSPYSSHRRRLRPDMISRPQGESRRSVVFYLTNLFARLQGT